MKDQIKNHIKTRIITISLFVLSAALIVVGLIQNQQADVLTKAIKICLECVGIG